MERLTIQGENLESLDSRKLPKYGELYWKLNKYEDLEEQGKLLKLPCAVGDIVYVKMQFGGIAEAEVRDYTYFISCGFCIVVTSKSFDKQNIPFSEFSKTVFLTREEAEAALKELSILQRTAEPHDYRIPHHTETAVP